ELGRLRRKARRLIFDFDDAVFLRDSYSQKGLHSARRRRRFVELIRQADDILAGNAYLFNHAIHAGAAPLKTHLIPTCVEPSLYPMAEHQRCEADVRLVWIGSGSTLRGLEAIRPIMEHVGKCCPEVCLKLICDRFLELRHLPVAPCRWSPATEAAELAGADIGISWLPDDAWSRGKCALKVLQYMAAGLPVVANPVGVQAELVVAGESGLLARTPAEWVEALRLLAGDPALRRRLGEAGRRRVEAEFSVAAGAARWLAVLGGLRRPASRKDAA